MNNYIHQIIKKLRCSKAKKQEIEKQLTADFMEAGENGEKTEDIIKRMGNPSEIAEEFNRSFPDSELKKYKKEKWVKRLAVAIAALLVLVAAAYWALPKYVPLEDSQIFSEDQVKAQAEAVVRFVSVDDYESLRECSNEKMQEVLNDEFMKKAKDTLAAEWGEFQSCGKIYSVQVTQMGKTYAVVQVNATFEKLSVTFSLSFDRDLKLAGLYMK